MANVRDKHCIWFTLCSCSVLREGMLYVVCRYVVCKAVDIASMLSMSQVANVNLESERLLPVEIGLACYAL